MKQIVRSKCGISIPELKFNRWTATQKKRCGCQVFTGNGTGFYRIVRLRQGEEMFLLFLFFSRCRVP